LSAATDNVQSCALRANGTVACGDGNVFGQLGDGTTSSRGWLLWCWVYPTSARSAPAHSSAALAFLNDGGACWGDSDNGQLGTGKSAPSTVPLAVGGLP
jgi:hypothetical protein